MVQRIGGVCVLVIAGASPSTPKRLPIGQTLYPSYLDEYHRRLRKGANGPSSDAAGEMALELQKPAPCLRFWHQNASKLLL